MSKLILWPAVLVIALVSTAVVAAYPEDALDKCGRLCAAMRGRSEVQ